MLILVKIVAMGPLPWILPMAEASFASNDGKKPVLPRSSMEMFSSSTSKIHAYASSIPPAAA